MPPAIGPSSSTTTSLPWRARQYAVLNPAIPAPTTHTSASSFPASAGRSSPSTSTHNERAAMPLSNASSLTGCSLRPRGNVSCITRAGEIADGGGMKRKHWRFGKGFRVAIGNERAQVAEMVIARGDSEGGPHNRHRGADQWLFVVSGTGRARVNGKRYPLRAGSLLVI